MPLSYWIELLVVVAMILLLLSPNESITYQIKNQSRVINSVEFKPNFRDCLVFHSSEQKTR